jgi:hypothetical protein
MALSRRLVSFARDPKTRRRMLAMSDQAASGLPQILLTVLAARYFQSVRLFAAIGLAMVAYYLVIGGIRAVIGETLLSLYSHEPPRVRRRVVADLQGASLFLGALAGVGLGVVSIVLGGPSGAALLALGLFMPLLMMEDAWRYVFIVDRPGAAVTIDVVWVLTTAVGLSLAPAGMGVGWFVGMWGLGGALGALLGAALGWWGSPGRPHPWRWLLQHRSACSLYFGEFLTSRAVAPFTQTALAGIAGMAALGAVRASLVFFGPLFTLQGGMYLVAVPDGAKARNAPRQMLRMMMVVAALSAGVAAVWTAVGLLLPDSAGRGLLGPTWDDAEALVLPMGVMLIAATLFSGALFGLRALGDARRSFLCRLRTAPGHLVLPLAGGAYDGARGFALGLALAEAIAAVVWWRAFVQALHEIEPAPAAEAGESDPGATGELPAVEDEGDLHVPSLVGDVADVAR